MHTKLPRIFPILLASTMLSACQLLPAEETLPPMPVIHAYEVEEHELVTVMRGDLVSTASVNLTYGLAKQQNLSFSVGGLYIDTVFVSNGQQINAGDVLATLEQTDIQAQIKAQRHQLNVLYTESDYLKQSLDMELSLCDGLLTSVEQELQQLQASSSTEENTNSVQAQIDALLLQKQSLQDRRSSAQSTYDQQMVGINDSIYVASLRLHELNSTLKQRQLIAEIDGSVTYVANVEDGQRSVKDKEFITISDLDSAAFITDSEYATYFPAGTEVIITCDKKDYEAVSVDAAELGIEASATEEPTHVYFKLKQPDPALEENDHGTITLTLEQRTNVLYVQKKAIRTANGENFVYLLDEEGLRTMQSVTTGLQAGNFVEIVAGLNEGDRVIID